MGSKVVHSHVHFERPMVTVVDGRELFLVFRIDPVVKRWTFAPNCFRVETDREKVNRLRAASPGAFAVRCLAHDELPQWILLSVDGQEGDPVQRVLVNGKPVKDSRGRVVKKRVEDSSTTHSTRCTLDRPTSMEAGFRVADGDVVEFALDSRPERCFRFSLFKEGDEEETQVPEPSRKRLRKAPVPRLPEEMLREIVEHLPVEVVVESLPLVSPVFHKFARERTVWPSMQFSTGNESFRDDHLLIVEKGADTCVSLSVEHPAAGDGGGNRLLDRIFRRRWPKLRRLHLCGAYDADVFAGMRRASDDGLFPELEELFVLEELGSSCRIRGCLFPKVKVLTVKIVPAAARGSSFDVSRAARKFYAQFPNLERLRVLWTPAAREYRHPFPRLHEGPSFHHFESYVCEVIRSSPSRMVPRLKELELVGLHEATAGYLHFKIRSLEVLVLDFHPDPAWPLVKHEFPVPLMVAYLQRLSRLYVRGASNPDWNSYSQEDPSLNRLDCLAVGVVPVHPLIRCFAQERSPSSSYCKSDFERLAETAQAVKDDLPGVFKSSIRNNIAWLWKEGGVKPWKLGSPFGKRTGFGDHECFYAGED